MKLSELVRLGYALDSDDASGWIEKTTTTKSKKGSGVAFFSNGKLLLLKRSNLVTDPGLWCVPGGSRPIDKVTGRLMGSWPNAIKEAKGKLGSLPPGITSAATSYTERRDGFKFETWVIVLPPMALEWNPNPNWEAQAWGWFGQQELPKKQHPGLTWFLNHTDVWELAKQ